MANLYIKGVDISGYQPNVDFNAVKNDGVEVCIIKATESTIYPNSAFDYQVNGCHLLYILAEAVHHLQEK